MTGISAGRVAGAVPEARTTFVGRAREIADLRRVVAAERLVTLTGPGGVGKTRLAARVASAASVDFDGDVCFVELATLVEGRGVAQAVATGLGLRLRRADAAAEGVVEHVGHRRLLLVLDNCEHLVDACARLVDELLGACSRMHVLATSRIVLDVGGEHVHLVPPLSVGGAGSEARTLLVDRVRTFRPEFAVTPDNERSLDTICTRLDGVPLTIELAASRLRSLAADQLVDRLRDRFAILTHGLRTAEPRQQTLRALVDWSYDLCSPVERRLWARLAVVQGTFDIDTAEAVCSDSVRAPLIDGHPIVDLVDQLVAQSVLVVEDGDGDAARYRMLETLREYGMQRLHAAGEENPRRRRHLEHFLGRAELACREWCTPDQAAELRRLRLDHDNLLSALAWAAETPGAEELLLRVAAALRYHWFVNGFLGEGRHWLDRALRARDVQPRARTRTLWVAAWVTALQGDDARARERVVECRALATRVGDPNATAYADHVEGTAALFRGDLDLAIASFDRADAAHVAQGEPQGRLGMLFQLAIAHCHRRDPTRARAVCESAIAVADEHGELWGRSYAVWVLAYVTWLDGDPGEAERLALDSLRDKSRFADLVGSALVVELLAWIAAGDGRGRLAVRRLAVARLIWTRLGTTVGVFGPQLADQHSLAAAGLLDEFGAEALDRAAAELGRGPVETAVAGILAPAAGLEPAGDLLTPRERQVAELVGRGRTSKQIAAELVVSARTVDAHVEHIRTKLGVTSRAQIAYWLSSRTGGTAAPWPGVADRDGGRPGAGNR